MSRLLNCFGRIETEVDTSGYPLIDTSVPGQYEIEMGPGIYRIVLIGGGGGGAKTQWAAGHNLFYAYAQGGVAATADFFIETTVACIASITVGAGGASDYRLSGAGTTATNGNSSYILGIPDLTVNCGPGTAGYTAANTATPGTMGVLTLEGSSIIKVDMNSNEHPITSSTSYSVRNNLNWPTASNLGRGGGATAGSGGTVWNGGPGYVLIKYYNKNYFHPEDL